MLFGASTLTARAGTMPIACRALGSENSLASEIRSYRSALANGRERVLREIGLSQASSQTA